MLSHGTLLFDSDLQVLNRVLKTDLQITESRSVTSIPSVVTNISGYLEKPMDMASFRAALQSGLSRVFGKMNEYRLTPEDREAVDRLVNIKYKSWDWTFGRTPEFAVRHRIKINSGNVDVYFNVKNGIIRSAEPADKTVKASSLRKVTEAMVGTRYDGNCSWEKGSNSDTN